MTEAKCLASRCKNPVEFRVQQLWNGKTVHTCADHVPGRGKGGPKAKPVPNPTHDEVRGAYHIFPMRADTLNPYYKAPLANPQMVVMLAGSKFDGVTYHEESIANLEHERAEAAVSEGAARRLSLGDWIARA